MKNIYVDMDGTLNYHQTAVKAFLERNLEIKFEQDVKDIKWFQDIIPFNDPKLRALAMFHIYSLKDFWLGLVPDPDSEKGLLQLISKGYKIKILTSTPPRENISDTLMEMLGGETYFENIGLFKLEWLRQQYKDLSKYIKENSTDLFEFICVRGLSKGEFIEEGSIVIDDKYPFRNSDGNLDTEKRSKCKWIRVGLENHENENIGEDIFFRNWQELNSYIETKGLED